MAKGAESSVEKVAAYNFELPDRTVKYPFDKMIKTQDQLKSELGMINEAIADTDHTLLTVNWKLLIVDPLLTVTFIEAKTGLMSTLKRLHKVREAIEKEIEK